METVEYYSEEKTPENIKSITTTKLMTEAEIQEEFLLISFKDKMEIKVLQEDYNNTMYKLQKLIENEINSRTI